MKTRYKKMGITKKVDVERAALVVKTSRIAGVSKRSVQRVLNGDQNNPEVMEIYMDLMEGEKQLEENLLIKAVKDLIPL